MSEEGIILVGGGIAGVATAWFLARAGAREVVLVEKEPQLGMHSSGRNAAILRTWTGDPVLDEIALESADFLRNPPGGFCERPLIDRLGLIVVREQERETSPEWRSRLQRRDDFEVLSQARMRRLAPHCDDGGRTAYYFPNDGRIDIALLLDSFARGARALGARFELGAEVHRIVADDGQVQGVELVDGRVITAERVLIAAGGWAGQLGKTAGSRARIRATRRHLLVTPPDARVEAGWPVVWSDALPFYVRPESGGLLMCPCDQSDVDPSRCETDASVLEMARAKACRMIPAFADSPVARVWAGVRAFTDDRRFLIGADKEVSGLYFAAGLGGHGMTCSAAVGRLAAQSLLS